MSNKGFSLIELLIVIVIIGIIVVIAVPSLLESKKAAAHKAAVSILRNIASAEATYSAKPTTAGAYGDLAQLVSSGLLDNRFAQTGKAIDGFIFSAAGSDATVGTFNVTATANAGLTYTDSANLNAYYIQQDNVVRDKDGSPVNQN